MPTLTTNLAGLSLNSPLIAASGTCGYVGELAEVLDTSVLGAIVTKSITREPREGNAPWRVVDLPGSAGMLNAIGLANVGLDAFIRDKLPGARDAKCAIFASVAGNSIDDYVAVASAFDSADHVPAVELNVSCPNTADGLQFGENAESLRVLLKEVRPVLKRAKMIVKLSPSVSDIVHMASTAIDSGADVLTLINTMPAMSIDVNTRRTRLAAGGGGLSGPALHPIAVRMVHEVYTNVAKSAGVPIIGVGGVMRWEEAAEFILAGATAVGMGTALFVDPTLPVPIARGLSTWVQQQGCSSLTDLIGRIEPS